MADADHSGRRPRCSERAGSTRTPFTIQYRDFIHLFVIKSAARHSVNVWLVNSGTQGSEETPGCFTGRELTPSPLTLKLLPWTGHRNAPHCNVHSRGLGSPVARKLHPGGGSDPQGMINGASSGWISCEKLPSCQRHWLWVSGSSPILSELCPHCAGLW